MKRGKTLTVCVTGLHTLLNNLVHTSVWLEYNIIENINHSAYIHKAPDINTLETSVPLYKSFSSLLQPGYIYCIFYCIVFRYPGTFAKTNLSMVSGIYWSDFDWFIIGSTTIVFQQHLN